MEQLAISFFDPEPVVTAQHPDGDLNIYVDGSIYPNPGGNGGYAAIATRGNTYLADISGAEPATTNNRMEIKAAMAGLQLAQEHGIENEQIVIWSDSLYVVKGINEWLPGWERKGWYKIKNPELWQEFTQLRNAVGGIVRFDWIRGHDGNEWNERADVLAARARKWFQDAVSFESPRPGVRQATYDEYSKEDGLSPEQETAHSERTKEILIEHGYEFTDWVPKIKEKTNEHSGDTQ